MTRRARTFGVVAIVTLLAPALASGQALVSLASVRVQYATRKNTVKPQGDLKAQLDALDAQIAEAARLGRNGELRRLYAKGVALLNGRVWTDEAVLPHRSSCERRRSSPTPAGRSRSGSSKYTRRC